jgi:hypothetical protein
VGIVARSAELNVSGDAAEAVAGPLWNGAVNYPEVVLPPGAWVARRTEEPRLIVGGTEAVLSTDVVESGSMFVQVQEEDVVEWARGNGVEWYQQI